MNLRRDIRSPAIWACGLIIIGILGLSGWILHSRTVITIVSNGVTMAPISAFLFILVGISMILSCLEKSDSKYTLVKNILLIPPILMGSWVLIDTITGNPVHIDWNVHPPDTIFWMAPESSISPISALLFIGLTCGIFGCHTYKKLTFWIALIILISGGVFILGYAAGSPLLYGGEIKPVSLLSACAFFLGGLGLFLGVSSPEQEMNQGV